jgi:N-acetylglucosamine repressor
MRRINPSNFKVATRGTSREINRQIALTLIRMNQPISRADLARIMKMRRGAVSLLVNELLAEGLIFEGAKGDARRGRKPQFLYIDSRNRCVLAVDVRATRTYLMVTDLVGKQLLGINSFATEADDKTFVIELARRIKAVLAEHTDVGVCQGIGVVVPGMVDYATSRVLNAPTLGWRDVDLRAPLSEATGFPVFIENSGKACALSQMWGGGQRNDTHVEDLVFVSISDGVGVGIVMHGQILRGRHNIAGEYGHIPLDVSGPKCACGATGCWEAFVSNPATLARYFGRTLAEYRADTPALTIDDLITRARQGDSKAVGALETSGKYLGYGLASIINSVDPMRIYIGGENTTAWDLVEPRVKAALSERVLTKAALTTELLMVSAEDYPRLRGAAALVASPAFAAPVVA